MKKALTFAAALSLPMLALAQTVETVLQRIMGIINIATFIVVGLALLFFFWGLAKYILGGPGSDDKGAGRNMMIWGIIALFVMVSVWGLVRVLSNTFGIGTGGSPAIPGVGGIGVGGGSGTNVNVGVQGSSGGFWASFPWGN